MGTIVGIGAIMLGVVCWVLSVNVREAMGKAKRIMLELVLFLAGAIPLVYGVGGFIIDAESKRDPLALGCVLDINGQQIHVETRNHEMTVKISPSISAGLVIEYAKRKILVLEDKNGGVEMTLPVTNWAKVRLAGEHRVYDFEICEWQMRAP